MRVDPQQPPFNSYAAYTPQPAQGALGSAPQPQHAHISLSSPAWMQHGRMSPALAFAGDCTSAWSAQKAVLFDQLCAVACESHTLL